MTWIQSIILGIIQGITEFLPVSSSAHLVIFPYLLGWDIPANQAFVFDVFVQVATLFAVIAFFWKDLSSIFISLLKGVLQRKPFDDPLSRLGWLLILATLPAGFAGLLLKNLVEKTFASPLISAMLLIVTGLMLLVAERIGKRNRSISVLKWNDAVTIGLFQAVAIFPGISRSGACITGGMTRNLKRPDSARLAFLMSVPIMLAAGLLASLDLSKIPNVSEWLISALPGFIASAIVGYFSIRWLLHYLITKSFYIFSIYCFCLAALVFIVRVIRY